MMIEWDKGETTYEPLSLIIQDDPITCAFYAKKHVCETHLAGSISRNMSKPEKTPQSSQAIQELSMGAQKRSSLLTSLSQEESM